MLIELPLRRFAHPSGRTRLAAAHFRAAKRANEPAETRQAPQAPREMGIR